MSLKYEKPIIIPFNSDKAETGLGACAGGSADSGHCQDGMQAGNHCKNGSIPRRRCRSGSGVASR